MGILRGHTDSVECIVVSRDSKFIISSSDDTTVRVWILEEMDEVCILHEHKTQVFSVSLSFCNRYVISASDRNFWVWRVKRYGKKIFNKFE